MTEYFWVLAAENCRETSVFQGPCARPFVTKAVPFLPQDIEALVPSDDASVAKTSLYVSHQSLPASHAQFFSSTDSRENIILKLERRAEARLEVHTRLMRCVVWFRVVNGPSRTRARPDTSGLYRPVPMLRRLEHPGLRFCRTRSSADP
jgi:hypothetical protein